MWEKKKTYYLIHRIGAWTYIILVFLAGIMAGFALTIFLVVR